MRLGPPGGHWRWEFTVAPPILDDPPMFKALCDYNIELAARQADKDGFVLEGDPVIEQRPLVWVEDWNEDGGAYLSPDIARSTGVTDPPRWIECVATWPCRTIIDREGDFV